MRRSATTRLLVGVLAAGVAGCSALLDLDADFDADAAVRDGDTAPDASADAADSGVLGVCMDLMERELEGRSPACHECHCGSCEGAMEACAADPACPTHLACGLTALLERECPDEPEGVDCVLERCDFTSSDPAMQALLCSVINCPEECLPELICAPPQPPVASDCGAGGETYTFVVSELRFAEWDSDSNQVTGFNVDGCNTDDGGPTGCGHMDGWYDIDGDGVVQGREGGVDEQFNQLAPSLVLLGFNLQEAVGAGELLLLFRLEGVTDWETDGCVDVSVLPVAVFDGGAPETDGEGRIQPGQQFTLDADGPQYHAQGRIEGGRLIIGPEPFSMHLTIEGYALPLSFHDVQMGFTVGPSTLHHGVIGGAADVDALMDSLTPLLEPDLEQHVHTLLSAIADLEPDELNDHCQSVSFGMEFVAVEAELVN